MDLPVMPPVKPMLAKSVPDVPEGDMLYEPKWDGFRCLVFRDGDEVELGSRNERPLTRYFPEMVQAVKANLPDRVVLDGEIVVALDGKLDFERLQERIHPAASRVNELAVRWPSSYVAFDCLARDDESLMGRPFAERRAVLEEVLAGSADPVLLTPISDEAAVARQWFVDFEGAGLDGVIAKPASGIYRPDVRAMFKIKHTRTCDVVLAGFRWHKASTAAKPLLGSMLLGLYTETGDLAFVGVSASFSTSRRAELVEEVDELRCDISEHPWSGWGAEAVAISPEPPTARKPGSMNRWNSGKDMSFVPLRPTRVLEVGYDAMQGTRFRHTAQFKRWRPDRDPASCTFEQLERPVDLALAEVLTR
jgi:ATP-dependent DNA ligase